MVTSWGKGSSTDLSVSTIGNVLRETHDLKAILPHLERLSRVKELLNNVLPVGLAEGCRPVNLVAPIMVLSAKNAAIAVKLRQLTPRIIESLAVVGDFREVRIRIERAPKIKIASSITVDVADRAWSAQTVQHFELLRQRLRGGSAAIDVLDRVLRQRRQR